MGIDPQERAKDVLEGYKKKIVLDYLALQKVVEGARAVGRKVVVTIGSWDMIHIGHVRYMTTGKSYGDILIVGADSDRALKSYKGEERPIIPEGERMEMLSYLQGVDYITLIDDVVPVTGDDGKVNGEWQFDLLKQTRPDIYIAVEGSYSDEQLDGIRKYCGEVVILPRQAETSTSSTIEKAIKIRGKKVIELLMAALAGVGSAIEEVKKMLGVVTE